MRLFVFSFVTAAGAAVLYESCDGILAVVGHTIHTNAAVPFILAAIGLVCVLGGAYGLARRMSRNSPEFQH